MSSNRIKFTILWVDEENDSFGFVDTCRRYDIAVRQFYNWGQAEDELKRNFDSYSAIVLDANCVINPGESPNPDFLYQVSRELTNIFSQNEESLPWYVMSSGTMAEFDVLMKRISMGERDDMSDRWGRVFYRKGTEVQELCTNIRRAAAEKISNKIRKLYSEVFETMDRYMQEDSVQTMLDILTSLHFPEEMRDFDPVLYYTQLRRILEQMFRVTNTLGILPDEVLGDRDKVNLTNSSLYLAGRDVNIGDGRMMRFGHTGQYVFPPVISQIIKSILVVANKNSHTVELDNMGKTALQDMYNSLHSNNILFGYTLHLCDVIVWFGRNIERVTKLSGKINGDRR